MACEIFVPKKFKTSSITVIHQANDIISEWMAKGYKMTLRQLFYQFVSRDLIPNTPKSYNRLGVIINDARLAGYIDWDAIEDRTRNLRSLSHWANPRSVLKGAERGYRLDRWDAQNNYCEVWVEKEALINVVERICAQLDVPFFACRGYVSQSEQYWAGKRLAVEAESRKGVGEVVIFHLGDHDPSGMDMTRDNLFRLDMFSHGRVRVERIALNMDQVEEYDPPPNYAKAEDARFKTYVEEYGDTCWELDALPPDVLTEIIKSNIEPLIDWKQWKMTEERERNDRRFLRGLVDNVEHVREYLHRLTAWSRGSKS